MQVTVFSFCTVAGASPTVAGASLAASVHFAPSLRAVPGNAPAVAGAVLAGPSAALAVCTDAGVSPLVTGGRPALRRQPQASSTWPAAGASQALRLRASASSKRKKCGHTGGRDITSSRYFK